MNSTHERKISGPPLVSSEKNGNGVASRKPKTREITSRYKSSTPLSSSSSSSLSTPTVPSLSRRCPSPSITRSSSLLEPKRAQSVERKRPTNPSSSPFRPTTPVHESKFNKGIADAKRSMGRSPESLWPSTRSLCVSFQADSFTLPVTKRERHVSHNSDRALASSGNRHSDSPSLLRKMSPERKRTPLRGKTAGQSENAKPVDNSPGRIIDQHRWPGSSLVKGSNALSRSVDLSDRPTKAASLLIHGWGARSDVIGRRFHHSVNSGKFVVADHKRAARRMSFDRTAQYDVGRNLNREILWSDEGSRPSDYPSGDADPSSPECCLRNSSDSSSSVVDSVSTASDTNVEEHYADSRRYGTEASSPARGVVSSRFWQEACNRIHPGQIQRSQTLERGSSCVVVPPRTAARPKSVSLNRTERAVSTPRSSRSQSLPSSPYRTTVASSASRGMSPSRIRGGMLPSSNTPVSQTNSCSSILNFISEVKKGKKGLNQIEDAHQLRILHNRYLQWRLANARVDATCAIQNVAAEDLLYSVYTTTSDLRHNVILKRIKLQQLRQDINLYLILKEQVPYLDDWVFIEKDHYSSLFGVVEALEANTVRLPVTTGARADIQAVKETIVSAVEVIQVMGSSISSLLSKVDRMNDLLSELVDVTLQAKAFNVECGDLLSRITTFQVEESSHRTHLMQLKRAIVDGKQTNLPVEAMV